MTGTLTGSLGALGSLIGAFFSAFGVFTGSDVFFVFSRSFFAWIFFLINNPIPRIITATPVPITAFCFDVIF